MPINKPYYRIIRPEKCGDGFQSYEFNNLDKYVNSERPSLCKSFSLLEQDLRIIFEYIDPSTANFTTYSHRLYELLLRACTEFETHCKSVLKFNGYKKIDKKGKLISEDYWNITDYKKINQAMRLTEYKVTLCGCNSYDDPIILDPFIAWKNSDQLGWYRSYNEVKHHRSDYFHEANLENVIDAVAAVFCILFAQFATSINPYFDYESTTTMCDLRDENNTYRFENLIFDLEVPIWSDNECYDFDVEKLKKDPHPYQQFIFK